MVELELFAVEQGPEGVLEALVAVGGLLDKSEQGGGLRRGGMARKGAEIERIQDLRVGLTRLEQRVQDALRRFDLLLDRLAVEEGQRLRDGGSAGALRIAGLHAGRATEGVQQDG